MLLVIPTSLTTSLNAIPETRSTRSALPALNPAKQVPIHPPLNAPDETSHGLFSNTTASQNSAKAVEELRDDIQRRQGAVSLKDVVAKQRSKKRLADPSFLTSQENVTKKVRVRFMRYTSILMKTNFRFFIAIDNNYRTIETDGTFNQQFITAAEHGSSSTFKYASIYQRCFRHRRFNLVSTDRSCQRLQALNLILQAM